jgi:hypothetical protein
MGVMWALIARNLVAFLIIPTNVLALDDSGSVDIAVFNCAPSQSVPVLRIAKGFDDPVVPPPNSWTSSVQNGIFHYKGTLPAGSYRLAFESQDCVAAVPVGILTGHPRHGVVQLAHKPPKGERTLARERGVRAGSLFGSLPYPGFKVGYFDDTGSYVPVMVEGDAYYLDSTPVGHYTLEVDSIRVSKRIEVQVPGLNTIRNISLSDLEEK